MFEVAVPEVLVVVVVVELLLELLEVMEAYDSGELSDGVGAVVVGIVLRVVRTSEGGVRGVVEVRVEGALPIVLLLLLYGWCPLPLIGPGAELCAWVVVLRDVRRFPNKSSRPSLVPTPCMVEIVCKGRQ
jgi:hypothetical protein